MPNLSCACSLSWSVIFPGKSPQRKLLEKWNAVHVNQNDSILNQNGYRGRLLPE